MFFLKLILTALIAAIALTAVFVFVGWGLSSYIAWEIAEAPPWVFIRMLFLISLFIVATTMTLLLLY